MCCEKTRWHAKLGGTTLLGRCLPLRTSLEPSCLPRAENQAACGTQGSPKAFLGYNRSWPNPLPPARIEQAACQTYMKEVQQLLYTNRAAHMLFFGALPEAQSPAPTRERLPSTPKLISTQPAATAMPQNTTNLPCDISACGCTPSVCSPDVSHRQSNSRPSQNGTLMQKNTTHAPDQCTRDSPC